LRRRAVANGEFSKHPSALANATLALSHENKLTAIIG